MFLCKDCFKIFKHMKQVYEYHGEPSLPPEIIDACPYCGGVACVEAIECDICNKYIQCDYIKIVNGDTICSNCYIKYDMDEL